ncbi:FkbM family methyltransferase [Streptomyces himalayensis]|uniref:FkbM family methyltransferase n=1 Tax=Streptomyces himalayensis subsp. himalayensis TaxID=2756131 RepID=A0A7W0I7E3_9ACTN|nr:FkbM family methyltransferase [Streptomyces himalayensis]MBA2945200.1 FkbM family methyltransferase [Streptomyces himalayensis subsp. himalayensis]
MTLLHGVRTVARRFGIDVDRFPECSLHYRVVQLMLHNDINVVLDVGANSGEYGAMLRRFGYQGRIVSFEPVEGPRRTLERRAAADALWSVQPYALGREKATVTINVAGNGSASSSVLSMLPRHTEVCPESRYVDRQKAEQHRLDEVWNHVADPGDRVFLKIDVQGYEEAVLQGAGDLVGQCSGLQVEVSCVPLYEDGMQLQQALDLAQHKYGLTLMSIVPGFTDHRTGQMLQCDAVFLRGGTRT